MEPLTQDELRILNKLFFGYYPDRIGEKELIQLFKQAEKQDHSRVVLLANPKLFYNLYRNLIVTPDKGCWIKEGKDWSEYRKIYCSVFEKQRQYPAHRLSYYLMKPKFDQSLMACHFCDVKGCVNFLHLFQGTAEDNSIDYKMKRYVTK